MEYYSAIKKEQNANTHDNLVNLRVIMLCEKSQTKTYTQLQSHSYKILEKAK